MKKKIIGILILTLFIANIVFPAMSMKNEQKLSSVLLIKEGYNTDIENFPRSERDPIIHNPSENDIQTSSFDGIQNDMGYNVDIRDNIYGTKNIYIGEPYDTSPGRTGEGQLAPSINDNIDWYRFSVCEGQQIQPTLTSSESYSYILADTTGTEIGQTLTEPEREWLFNVLNEHLSRIEWVSNGI